MIAVMVKLSCAATTPIRISFLRMSESNQPLLRWERSNHFPLHQTETSIKKPHASKIYIFFCFEMIMQFYEGFCSILEMKTIQSWI